MSKISYFVIVINPQDYLKGPYPRPSYILFWPLKSVYNICVHLCAKKTHNLFLQDLSQPLFITDKPADFVTVILILIYVNELCSHFLLCIEHCSKHDPG